MFDTAIIAGMMAAKRTHELIPFCHPMPLEDCQHQDRLGRDERSRHRVLRARDPQDRSRDGGADRRRHAALTVYDMCKALTHGIEIREVALLSKTGGKRDYARATAGSSRDPRGGAQAR